MQLSKTTTDSCWMFLDSWL